VAAGVLCSFRAFAPFRDILYFLEHRKWRVFKKRAGDSFLIPEKSAGLFNAGG
jgi:hypothetical protein